MTVYFNHFSFGMSPDGNLRALYAFRELWGRVSNRSASKVLVRWFAQGQTLGGVTIDGLRAYFYTRQDELRRELGASVVGALSQLLTHVFVGSVSSDPRDEASRTGMLCVGVDIVPQVGVVQSIGAREFVNVTTIAGLEDTAACRVFYCNEPQLGVNRAKRGFVSDPHQWKHFHASGASWVESTKRAGGGQDGAYAKFNPALGYMSEEYVELERTALLDAMKSGKYSEGRITSHLCDVGHLIGASAGEEVSVVKVYMSGNTLHLRPYSDKEPS